MKILKTLAGIIMSLHLFRASTSDVSSTGRLRLLLAYESGRVALRQYNGAETQVSIEGRGWDLLWEAHLHKESSESVSTIQLTPMVISTGQSWQCE